MIRIYGLREVLKGKTDRISDVINNSMVYALKFPDNKRAHRFIYLDRDEFYYPDGRSEKYTVLEINMMEGRKSETKRLLIRTLFDKFNSELGITPNDLEITITEQPGCNWGFRGLVGDEANLNYKVKV